MPDNRSPCGPGLEPARTAALLALCCALLATGQAPDSILGPSILVFGAYKDGNEMKFATRGGGFVVDSRHVVTSLSQCCGQTREGVRTIPAVVAGDHAQPGKVLWSSQDMDLAVIEVESELGRPGAAITPAGLVRPGQAVYLVDYPDSPKEKPRIVEGRIAGTARLEGNANLFKSNAALSPSNAGGALFDACGNAIASNFAAKDGVTYSVTGDSILAALESIGVQSKVASGGCNGAARAEAAPPAGPARPDEPPNPNAWRMPRGTEWIALILILAVVGLAFRPARKQVVQVLTGRHRIPPQQSPPAAYPPPPPPLPGAARPVLRGLAGQYAGASIGLDPLQSTLGRDPRMANLVFPADAASVSKRHCTVRWDAGRRTFVLEDHGSTNGTFLATGERLLANQPRDLYPGERFYVGDRRNQFEVAME
jgi:hypothetical protein